MLGKDASKALSGWVQKLGPNEVLFVQGSQDRKLYILIQGEVEITQDNGRPHRVDTAEAFIGEIAALTGRPRTATVRTTKPSEFVIVPDVSELFAAHPKWGQRLATVLAQRLVRVETELQAAAAADDDDSSRILAGIINTLSLAMDPNDDITIKLG